MTDYSYKTYYEGYDYIDKISLTKLHRNREDAYIEMLDKLGISDEEYYSRGVELCCVREVKRYDL